MRLPLKAASAWAPAAKGRRAALQTSSPSLTRSGVGAAAYRLLRLPQRLDLVLQVFNYACEHRDSRLLAVNELLLSSKLRLLGGKLRLLAGNVRQMNGIALLLGGSL